MFNKFNEYFSSIADDIISDRKYQGKKMFTDYLNNPNNNSFSMFLTNSNEVLTNINLLNDRKAYAAVQWQKEVSRFLANFFFICLID